MGWETSDRGDRLPENWNALRAQVLKAAGHRCTWRLPSYKRCPRPATDVDHRNPGDNHSIENLQALCAAHHARKSAREGVQAKKKIKQSVRRRIEGHPGQVR